MAADFPQLIHVLCPVGRRKHMVFPAHLLISQAGLKEPAGCGSVQILSDKRIKIVAGKCLLGQQNLTPCVPAHLLQNPQIVLQLPLVNHIAGGGQLPYRHACSSLAFQTFTGSGFSSTTQGRPHLLRASIKGSGLNSSRLYTPGFFHWPVTTSMAPIMAGTPVV